MMTKEQFEIERSEILARMKDTEARYFAASSDRMKSVLKASYRSWVDALQRLDRSRR